MIGEHAPLLEAEQREASRRLRFLWPLVSLTFFAVAGGPAGIEPLVGTAGPLFSCIAVCVIGLLWSTPIALMTAELTTRFPVNGGYTVWVREAFKDSNDAFSVWAAQMAGWLQLVSSSVDAAIYPALFATYFADCFHLKAELAHVDASSALQLAFVIISSLLPLAGLNRVGYGFLLGMIIFLAPFLMVVLVAFTGVPTGTTVTGWEYNTTNLVGMPSEPDWQGFSNVLLWNLGSWEAPSALSGEFPEVTVFPKALAVVMIIMISNYCLPILAFAGLDGRFDLYRNGYFIQIGWEVGGTQLGLLMGAAQVAGVACLFVNVIVKNAYQLCGMAECDLLPPIFAKRMHIGDTDTPFVGIAFSAVLTVLLIPIGSFRDIVAVDVSLYCTALLLETAALFTIRSREQRQMAQAGGGVMSLQEEGSQATAGEADEGNARRCCGWLESSHAAGGRRIFRVPAEGWQLWFLFLPALCISWLGIVAGGRYVIMMAAALVMPGALGSGALCVYRHWNRNTYAADPQDLRAAETQGD